MNTHGLVDKTICRTNVVIPDKPPGNPEEYGSEVRIAELIKCQRSVLYFINNYVYILDDRTRQWVLFKLYPAQINILLKLIAEKYIILLKTRQLGASTLIGGAYFLWLQLFTGNAQNLILSKSEREAHALLGDRFKPMFNRLPSWMKPFYEKGLPDSRTEFATSNGGKTLSLPTSAGDSYTARACMVDEAALVWQSRTPLSKILLAVEPTIAAGGQLILVSKTDKSKPASTFNSIFKNAVQGKNDFFPLFAPWQAVPWRDNEWYESKRNFSLSVDGTMDYVNENYPETWEDALAPKQLDKRLPPAQLRACFVEMGALTEKQYTANPPPDLSQLLIYLMPEGNRQYLITVDAAENNPNSDASCVDVWDWNTGEQVANLSGRIEPSVLAFYVSEIAKYYNNAPIFVERNNHGGTVIALLHEMGQVRVLRGPDSTRGTTKYGLNTNIKTKAEAYAELARMVKDEEIIIHKHTTFIQLTSIEGRTLRAPNKENDDHAISAMLYAAARKWAHITMLLEFV